LRNYQASTAGSPLQYERLIWIVHIHKRFVSVGHWHSDRSP
jgi:hypothetical protein